MVLLVFDVTSWESFDDIQYWVNQLNENIDRKVIIFLIGNKIDCPNWIVDEREARMFAEDRNMVYFETSAQSGEGVKSLFD